MIAYTQPANRIAKHSLASSMDSDSDLFDTWCMSRSSKARRKSS